MGRFGPGRFGPGRRRLAGAVVAGLAAVALGLGLHANLAPAAGSPGASARPGPAPGPGSSSGPDGNSGSGSRSGTSPDPDSSAGTGAGPGAGVGLGTIAPDGTATLPTGRAPAGSAPVGLRIPALDLAVPLSRLGINPDRTVEVPTDFARAGWFRLGPAPGQPGSAVILGHVDSYRGPAVFYRLGSLRPGDRIEVTRADGATATFAVRTVRSYLKRDFPARQVYGSHGGRSLQLVTCGGEFDRSARGYLSNVVVYTELVSIVR